MLIRKIFCRLVPLATTLTFLGVGCYPQTTGVITPPPTARATAPASPQQTAAPKIQWRQEWEATVFAARKEGTVSLISRFPANLREALATAFKEKYGIETEHISGLWTEMWAKVEAERRAGLYLRDIAIVSIPGLVYVLQSNAAEPLDKVLLLPEVTDGNVWRDKKLPFYDNESKVFKFIARVGPTLLVNKDIVKPEEIRSWRSLLEPKWKEKILVHDPSVGGTGSGIIAAAGEIMGVEFLRELARQDPVMIRDLRQQVEWVAKEKYPIALGFDFIIMEEMRGYGAPLAHVVPSEGTYFGSGIGSMSMLSKAAHPNAAKVFVNWFLSREGQTIMAKAGKEQSRRLDVPAELAPDRLFQEGLRYIDFDTEYMVNKMLETMKTSREIFAAQYK